ncbi:MAG: hypothetical protein QJR08_00185 [Bacillota bacterium]|nr:hypothetical protein [Bacillota bacterium]
MSTTQQSLVQQAASTAAATPAQDGDALRALAELAQADQFAEFAPIFYRPGPGAFISASTTETLPEIVGVILAVRKARRHVVTVMDPAGNEIRQTECVLERTGRDGDFGVVQLGQDAGKARACAMCPYNKWGSATDDKGHHTRGKACREKRLLLVLPDGYAMPIVVSAPPMSIRAVTNWISGLATRGQALSTVKVKLRSAVSQQPVGGELRQFGVLSIETLRPLTSDEARAVLETVMAIRDNVDRWLSSPSLISEAEGADEDEAIATTAAAATAVEDVLTDLPF